MSDRTVASNNPTAGDPTSFQKSIMRRGTISMTLSAATGGASGSVTQNLSDLYITSGTGYIPRVEVVRFESSGGYARYYPLPYYTDLTAGGTTAGTMANFWVRAIAAVSDSLVLYVYYYENGASAGDVITFFYTVYSEAAAHIDGAASTTWDYKA